jgi:hypothetical protein
MKINILKARVKRNNLIIYAKDYFVDEDSAIIKSLNEEGKNALLGIKKNKNLYTIIGREYVYSISKSGRNVKIPLNRFLTCLHEESMRKGKLFANYKYLKFENERIWIKDKKTMLALWNTILFLTDNQSK